MKINLKDYKISKTKAFIQDEILLLFLNGITLKLSDSIIMEQKLKRLKFFQYKIRNKTTKKLIRKSVHNNLLTTIQNNMFLLTTEKKMLSNMFVNNFEQLNLLFLFMKLNNRFYSKYQLRSNFITNYNKNNLTFFKFGISNVINIETM